MADRIVQHTVEHVLAVLREDLAEDVRSLVGIGDLTPGLLGQLPFISVAAEAQPARLSPLGGTLALKREVIDGAPVDLGYVTGGAGEVRFTLSVWATTRPQVERVRRAAQAITWLQRAHTWEAPSGTLNRTVFLRCRLDSVALSAPVALAPAPPHFTISAANTPMRAAPDSGSAEVGRVDQGVQFELLGRDDDADWVQGCCFEGQAIWVNAQKAECSIPLAAVPVASGEEPVGIGAATATEAPALGATVWRQEFRYVGYLEHTREPIEAEGALIEELRIVRQLDTAGEAPDVERTRLFRDREVVVEEFPD